MKALERKKVVRLSVPTVSGYCWKGQALTSVDGGMTWIETGYNKLFKDIVAATAWKYEV